MTEADGEEDLGVESEYERILYRATLIGQQVLAIGIPGSTLPSPAQYDAPS